MNAAILENAGIDYAYGVKRFVGRAQLFEKVLTKFPKDTTFSRICAAYEAKDMEQLLAHTHEFKGMCGNIGLMPLYEVADAMVQMLRCEACSPQELETAFLLLSERYHRIRTGIEAALEESV